MIVMKKIIIQLIISSIFVFNSTFLLFLQEKVIQGRVTTFDSIPLFGASIKVKSTKEVVFSDTLGMFTVSCFQEDKLKVTAKGFSNQNVKIKEEINDVWVNLRLNLGPINHELAIGYGHVKDRDKLYAIPSLNENDMDFSHYGVQIINNEIIIRYPFEWGSNAAIVTVDYNSPPTKVGK